MNAFTLLSKKNLGRLAGVPMLAAALATHATAITLPSGGVVAAGNAAISQNGASVTVNQTSRAAVVNWSDFSVGSGGLVRFDNGSGATLNRVTGNLPSRIDGTVSATGSVYLVNRSGVVVGASGVVQTGGSFVASTLDIADAAFMAGGDLTFAGNSDALVINAGKIGSLGGDIALIARRVENVGDMTAANGVAGLAAGYEVLVRDGAHADGKFLVKAGGSGTAALNAGTIEAAAAELRANGGNIYALAGNTGGVIRARNVDTSGGRIVFDAGENGSVVVAGKADASSKTGNGGAITVTGSDIAVKSGARLDASGVTGGTILVGGDYQGGKNGPTYAASKLLNALVTTVESGATLVADGSASGKGGDVVVWADNRTSFAGAISATGLRGGDAEVSGKAVLDYRGTADLRGPAGFGTLLLDPADITISNAGTDTNFAPTGATSNISVATLVSALASANVTVTTSSGSGGTGNITVANAVSWSSASTLTLQADNNIIINAGITATNGGLTLSAKSTLTNGSTVIGLSGGSITTGASGTINVGTFTLQQGTWYQVGASLPSFAAKDFRIAGNGTTNTAFFLRFTGGDGSSGNPYLVSDIYGLQGIAGGASNGSGGTLANAATLGNGSTVPYYALATDIDASGTSGWNAGAGFRPIGSVGTATLSLQYFGAGRPFFGHFEGGNRTIRNLYVNRTTETFNGLFGIVVGNATNGGVIQNLTLDSARITGKTTNSATNGTGAFAGNTKLGQFLNLRAVNGAVSGGTNVGGIIGIFSSTGNVGLSLVNVSFSGTVTGLTNVGGILGDAEGTAPDGGVISSVFSNATVTGTGADPGSGVGGIAGKNTAYAISDAYALGNVSGVNNVGGVVGYLGADLSRVYSAGTITGTSYVGGVAGQIATGTLLNTYWNKTLNPSIPGGQLNSGTAVTVGVTGLTTAQMQSQANFAGFDFTNVWNAPTGGGTPTLQAFNAPAVTNITYAFNVTGNWTYGDTNTGVFTLSGSNWVYNGVGYTFSGVAPGDVANVSGVVGALRQGSSTVVPFANIFAAGTYTLSLTNLAGSAASKYALASTGNTLGSLTIAPAALTITATDATKTYGDVATLLYSSTGLKNGETVGSVTLASSGNVATANVGSYGITASGATGGTFDPANYTITYAPGTLTVNPAALTLTANDQTKTRGQTFTFQGTEFSTSGLKNGETVGSVALTSAGTDSGAAIGSYAIGISGATGGTFNPANYTITYTPGTFTVISDKNVNYVVGDATSTYGTLADLSGVSVSLSGLDIADVGNVTGVIGVRQNGATVTLAALTNAGTYQLVVASLTGTNSGEYHILDTGSTPGTLTINRLAVSIASQATLAGSRVYDGTTAATVATDGTLAGVASGDTGVSLALTASFADKNVGSGKTVSGTYALSGASAANYDLTGATTFSGTQSITAKTISVGTAGTVSGKTYDGTVAATVATNGALSGVVSGDTVNLALTGTAFSDKNAGASKAVSGTYAISGGDAGNYVLASNTFAGTAAIAAKTISVGTAGTVADKTYDGTVVATVTTNGALSGVVSGDTVNLAITGTAFADKNAGASKAVTGTYAISGGDAGNYVLASNTFAGTAAITPKTLTIASGATVAGTKVYDGTTGIRITGAGTLSGVLSGDAATLALTAAYADKNAGTGKAVNGTYALSGANAGNYVLADTAFLASADITPATLTYTATAATRNAGQTNPTFTGTVTGFVAGETQSDATAGTLAFTSSADASSAAGNYAINGTGLTATNYVFTQAAPNATALTVKAVTAGGVPLPSPAEQAALIADNPILPPQSGDIVPPPEPPVPVELPAPTPAATPPESDLVYPDNRRIGANIVFVSSK